MKSSSFFLFVSLILSFLVLSCSKDENPVIPPVTLPDAAYTYILTTQENLNSTLTNLLANMDTTSALDSIRKLFLQDTSVASAYSDIQGVNVQYKNGMRGGIFINGDDEESGGLSKIKNLPDYPKSLTKPQIVLPTSKAGIFINSHYYERSALLSRINFFDSFKNFLANQGYSADTVLYTSATLDKFAGLSSYGYIHIYSHGWAWPSRTNASEVYLLTGEKASEATTKKYWNDIQSGNIKIAFVRQTASNTYWINPAFFTKYNNFQNSGSLIYGGFCHSFRGTWANQLVTNAKAKVYLGYDWSVFTNFNIETSLDFLNMLTNYYTSGPITVGEYFNLHNDPVRVWKDNRWVTLIYNGASDFALWNSLVINSLLPDRGTTGTAVNISGTGFGNSQSASTVKFNGVTATATVWSDTLIKTSVPNGATTGNVIVKVDGKESNGMLFTIDGPEITTITPDSGHVGDIISIAGTKLGTDISAVKVYFNSIPATEITQVNDTFIGVKVPTNAVSGNVYVEVSGVASNTLYFKVLSEAPVIDRIEPSSALPGNYIRLYGVWKPTSTTPPNTYLRIGGIDYPIDPNLNWNAYSYLKLLLPEGVPTGMQEVYLIYDGQVSNKTNLYVGIPLDFILANSSTLAAFSQIYVELLKPDQTTTSTAIEIYTEPMSVQWDVRNFSSSYTLTNYYTEDFSGKISDDGMSITEFSVHKKSLTNSDDIIFTLKENESINLDSIYYSYYTTNLLQNIYRGPEYLADQEDILSKFDITGTIELTTGQVCTIQSLIPKVGETSYNLYLTFK